MKQKIEGEWEERIEVKDCDGYFVTIDGVGINGSKAKLVDFISDLLASERQRCVEETSDLFADFGDHGVIWVCPGCAKKYHGREYHEGVTNIYTRVRQTCQGCGEVKDIMHFQSYDQAKHNLEQMK